MSPSEPLPQPTAMSAPNPPPVFGQNPVGGKPKAKSAQPTFLGSGSAAPSPVGAKTLLGQ